MIHFCHANGCSQSDEIHPEIPFCKHHFGSLPEPHRQALWKERRKDGLCGACNPKHDEEQQYARSDRWDDMFNLGVAVLLVMAYDECGAPPEMHDAQGFCWGCGVHDAQKTYSTAGKVIEKFGLGKSF